MAAKEKELGDTAHRNLAEHSAKDAQFASKVKTSLSSLASASPQNGHASFFEGALWLMYG